MITTDAKADKKYQLREVNAKGITAASNTE